MMITTINVAGWRAIRTHSHTHTDHRMSNALLTLTNNHNQPNRTKPTNNRKRIIFDKKDAQNKSEPKKNGNSETDRDKNVIHINI